MVPAGPLRRVAAGTLASAVGNGAWYTSWALFLTRSVGLSPAQVGIGMTAAGVAGLVCATPAGYLADRLGAREVYATLLGVQAAAALAYVAVGGMAALVALFLVAAVVHTAGELLFVAASWGLSIPLMPRGAAGEYQGVFATGEATALMAAPALMTTLVADWGQPGWLVLAVIFLLPALAAVPVTRWALRTRTVAPAT